MTDFLTRRSAFLGFSSLLLAACSKKKEDDEGGTNYPNGGQGGQGGYGRGGLAGTGPGSSHEFKNTVGDTVRFEEDSSELSSEGRSVVDGQATWLAKYNSYSFTVEGHADERGTREYNLALGSRRANTVKDYLVAKGISSARIRTLSYGKERPLAGCDAASCWSQNRRAVTNLGS
jgi:peptidoglycan-associated lipoprotein